MGWQLGELHHRKKRTGIARILVGLLASRITAVALTPVVPGPAPGRVRVDLSNRWLSSGEIGDSGGRYPGEDAAYATVAKS